MVSGPTGVDEFIAGALSEMGQPKLARVVKDMKEAPVGPSSPLFQATWGGGDHLNASFSTNTLTPAEQQLVSDVVVVIKRHVRDGTLYDSREKLSLEVMRDLTAKGLFASIIPVEHGGKGFSFSCLLECLYQISKFGGFFAACLTSASVVIGPRGPLVRNGTDEQKGMLRDIANGQIGFFSLTEVDAGVNVPGLSAYAIETQDGYQLYALPKSGNRPRDGRKRYATGLEYGRTGVVVARVGGPEAREVGVFLLTAPVRDTETFTLHRYPLSAFAEIDNCGMTLNGFYVPREARIPGHGIKMAMDSLVEGRAALGSMYCGGIDYLLAQVGYWCKDRNSLGDRPLIEQRPVAESVAMSAAWRCAAAAMAELARNQVSSGKDARFEATICKVFVTEAARTIQPLVQDAFGGRMFETNHPIGRYLAVMLVGVTFEGPNKAILPKAFSTFVAEHVSKRFLPLMPILLERGLLKLDLTTTKGWSALAKMLGKKILWTDVAWGLRQAVRAFRSGFPSNGYSAQGISNPELRDYAAFARRKLYNWPLTVSRIMGQRGLELLEDTVTINDHMFRLADIQTMLALAYWAEGKDPSVVRASLLGCELLKGRITGKTVKDGRYRDLVSAISSDLVEQRFSPTQGVEMDSKLFTPV